MPEPHLTSSGQTLNIKSDLAQAANFSIKSDLAQASNFSSKSDFRMLQVHQMPSRDWVA